MPWALMRWALAQGLAQYVRDLLSEYAAASHGKLVWEAVDPNTKELEQEAEKLKVPKMRRGRVSSNKVEIGSSYLGVALTLQPEHGSLDLFVPVTAVQEIRKVIQPLFKGAQ